MFEKGVYFVSGIGTGIGKSVATGILARRLREKGVDAITVKMVQTGNDGFSEDIELHRRLMGGVKFEEDSLGLTAPQIFRFPSSAHLAARLEGRKVDTEKIAGAVEECARRREVVLVEGAGGLMVPLDEDLLAIDFVRSVGWPVVLVFNCSLGSINHTLLSIEALKTRGMKIAALIENWAPDCDRLIEEDTPRAVRRYLDTHGLEDVPIVKVDKVEL